MRLIEDVKTSIAPYLYDVTGRYAERHSAAIGDLLMAKAMGDVGGEKAANARLGVIITETMGIAEVLGAASMIRKAAGVLLQEPELQFARHATDLFQFRDSRELLADVTFQEALDDFVSRTPRVIRDAAERTARNIAKLYGEGRVVAFVRSAEQAVTERVQALIQEAIRAGIGESPAGAMIRMGVDQIRVETKAWTNAYSRMVFRTNVNTAVTAGRFRQAQDPAIKRVIPCMRFDAVGDSDTRDNHMAADGRIWRADNPVWNQLAPPLGYNCRCSVALVSLPVLRRMGRIDSNGSIRESVVPSGAHADEGFRHTGRPDLFIVSEAAS